VLLFTLLTLSVKQNRIRAAEMVYDNRQIKSMLEERTVLAPSRASIIFRDLTPELTGRAFKAGTGKLTMKGKLTRAPVE
jgi:hypothetical protein